MSSIDKRIVEMKFDNAQFEKGINTSIGSLDKLKSSLDFENTSKALDNLSDSAKHFSLDDIGTAVSYIADRFTFLGTIVQNIKEKVAAAVTGIVTSITNTVKSMTALEQAGEGFGKYSDKTTAVATLQAQGYALDTVNEQLEKLNWFTDETSYNFVDMTKSIGKFTASGQGLEESVNAMMGIATWAALSGQNAGTASSAMYQLAQAMSVGSLKLDNYKSIQNASMDTAEFRQKALDAAVALGTLQEAQEGVYKTTSKAFKSGLEVTREKFTESLTDSQWFTSEVMMKVFSEYASAVDPLYEYTQEHDLLASEAIQELGGELNEFGIKAFKAAQEAKTWEDVVGSVQDAVSTGWMTTFELIFGNYEEAKVLWTDLANELYDVFAEGGNARNEMLSAWKEAGGRDDLVEAFWNIYNAIREVTSIVGEAFRDIFPPMTAERLLSATKALKEFSERLTLSDVAADKLSRSFKGLFAVFDIVWNVVKSLAKSFLDLIHYILPSAGSILDFTANIGDSIVAFDEWIKESDVFGEAFGAVTDTIKIGIDYISEAFTKVKDVFSNIYSNFTSPFKKIKSFMDKILPSLKEGVASFFDSFKKNYDKQDGSISILERIGKMLKTIFLSVFEAIKKIASILSGKLMSGDFVGFFDTLSSALLGLAAFKFSDFLKNFKSLFEGFDSFKSVGGAFSDALSSVKGVLVAYQDQLKADALMKIALAVGVLAAALVVLSGIDATSLATASAAIGTLFGELIGSMAFLTNNSGSYVNVAQTLADTKIWSSLSTSLIKISVAVLILTEALTAIAELEWEEIAKGLIGVEGLILIIGQAMKSMSKMNGSALKGSLSIVILAGALRLIVPVFEFFSKLKFKDLIKGIAGLGAVLLELSIFAKSASSSIGASTSVVILAAGLKILVGSFKEIASLNYEQLVKGVAGLGAILLELGLFTNNASSSLGASTSILILSSSLIIISKVLKSLGSMEWTEIEKGTMALGAVLLELASFTKIVGGSKKMISIGTGLVIVSASLEILADAMKKIGSFSWEQIAKGLVAIGVALGELAIGLTLMEGTFTASLSLVVATGALKGIAEVMKELGAMSLTDIFTALAALAGVFLTLGVAAIALKPLVGTILALSVAMVGFGAGLTLVGVGLLAASAALPVLAAGITSLSASISISAQLIVSAIKNIVLGIVEILPEMVRSLGRIIKAVCQVIIEAAPTIAKTVNTIITSILTDLDIPGIVSQIFEFVDAILDTLIEYVGPISDKIFTILIDALNVLATRMPELVVAAINVLSGFVTGLKEAIGNISPEQVAEFLLSVTALVLVFKVLANSVKDAGKAAIAVGLMVVLIASITVAFIALSEIDATTTLAIATSISEVILAMAVVMKLLGGLPISSALTAIADLDLMIGNMALVMTALGALYQIDGLEKLINDGAKFLTDIGEGIGGFVGGIIGGFAAGVSEGFPTIADNLSQFGERIKPFVESMSGVDPSSMQGVGYLASAILKLTAAELIDGVSNFLSGITGENGMAKLGQELEDFAPHLKAFYEACSDLNPVVVTVAGYAAGAIAEFANKVPRTGGWLQKITGENDITKFGEAIASFGPNLKQFADDVTGLDSGSVETAASAASIIAEFATKVPKTDGWVQKITGENDIASFGEAIASFGPNLKQFADDVNGLNADDVTTASTAAEMLVVLANELPNTGGLVQWFEGEASLSEFGEGLVDLGTALKSFGESVKGLNNDDISATTAVANELVVLSTSVSDWLDSSLNLSTFGGQVADFGSYLQTYWGETNNISIPFLSALTSEIQKLVDVANTLSSGSGSALESFGNGLKSIGESGIQNFADSITGSSGTLDSAISTMMSSVVSSISNKKGEVLTAFGNVMSDASDKVGSYKVNFTTTGTGLAQSLIDGIKLRMLTMSTSFSNSIIAVINNINAKKTSFNNAGSGLMDSLISGIKTKSLTVNSTFTSVVNSIVSTIQSKYSTLSDLGSTCLEKFSSGFSTNGTTLSSSITSAISVAVSAIKSYYNSFYNAGDYLVTGFVNGISDNIWRAKAKAVAMAEAALNGARDRLKIQSPSKEFYKIGDFAGLGLVNALNKYEEKAYEAGEGMGAGAMSGLQSAVSKAASIIEEGIDSTPTIRPVMDLSEIQNGTNRLYSMMNDVNGYALSGSIGIAGTTAAGMNQMKAFGEIDPTELALNNLMNAISGMPTGDTYDNKFYITGDNPQEIAEEVSRILRLQVERRNAVWA